MDYPICQRQLSVPDPVDRCVDPVAPLIEELSDIERQALLIFQECWDQWEWSGGGMSPRMRDSLPFDRVESAVRSHGIAWSSELKDLVTVGARLILKQQSQHLAEWAAAQDAKANG